MYKIIILAALGLTLSTSLCSAQTLIRHPLVESHFYTDPATGQLKTQPFEYSTLPNYSRSVLSINWSLAELALRLSDLHQGTSLKFAVQLIGILGGQEDGGLQSIPATRYYFSPGIIVEMPAKDGYLTGPVHISPGGMACD